MNDWYYAAGQQQQGPISREELVKLLSEGRVSPLTLVWNSSLAEWTPAERVPGLVPSPGTFAGLSASGPGASSNPSPASPIVAIGPGSPQPGPSNPYASPRATGSSFGAPPARTDKWEGHVKAVSILLIVAGALGLLAALTCGGFLIAIIAGAIPDINDADDRMIASVYLAAVVVSSIFSGVILAAGMRCLKFRGRILGIVACIFCILSCGMPGMGVGIYGLVIFCNSEVARLFEQRGGRA